MSLLLVYAVSRSANNGGRVPAAKPFSPADLDIIEACFFDCPVQAASAAEAMRQRHGFSSVVSLTDAVMAAKVAHFGMMSLMRKAVEAGVIAHDA